MHELLPDAKEIRVYQQVGPVTDAETGKLDQLVIVLPKAPKTSVFRPLPSGVDLLALQKRVEDGGTVVSRLPNARHTLVVCTQVDVDASAFEQLSAARTAIGKALTEKPGALGILVAGVTIKQQAALAEIFVAAALAAGFTMPAYKTKAPKPPIKSVRVVGLKRKQDFARVRAEATGNNLARWFAAMPPNYLDAAGYTDVVKSLARQNKIAFKRYSIAELEKLGAGAFLAVAQGNADDSAGILRLRYRPKAKAAKADVSLVGKGIIFDTGGNNLKPFQSMLDMHGDMQGSSVALGTLMTIAALKLPIAVDCWLAVTENRIGSKAYKAQDLITTLTGKTIQTIHTDAEGRMALADTLTLASRDKPKMIIDYATLTGAAMNAVTTRYSAIFSNHSDWYPTLRRVGNDRGERVWPFPIGKEFMEDLKSPVADMMQCHPQGWGDHILAASFLHEFVENDTPWIHIDLASGMRKGGLGHIPSDMTGFGVRYTMGLILDAKLHETLSV